MFIQINYENSIWNVTVFFIAKWWKRETEHLTSCGGIIES
jgi:hypothetical protein